MNIRFLTIPLMALCLVACSGSGQDDPSIPDPPTPTPDLKSIGFGGNSGAWQEAPTSRATDSKGLETLFKSFRVWGYKTTNNAPQIVMDGYNVEYKDNTAGSTTSNTADWEYVGIANTKTTQTIKYWDYSAKDYRFFAYAPADATNVTTSQDVNTSNETNASQGTASSTLSFHIPYSYSADATETAAPYISELWLSDNTSSSTSKYGENVTLTFAPFIAKVRFRFKYPEDMKSPTITDIAFHDKRWEQTETDNYTWKGKDADYQSTPISGTIIATYPLSESSSGTSSSSEASSVPTISWETAENTRRDPIILTIPYEEENDQIHQTDVRGKWYYVPPLKDIIHYTQGDYLISIKVNGNPVSATVNSEYMQWQAGYQYTYTFKISDTGTYITFEKVEVEKWNPNNNIDNNGSGTKDW